MEFLPPFKDNVVFLKLSKYKSACHSYIRWHLYSITLTHYFEVLAYTCTTSCDNAGNVICWQLEHQDTGQTEISEQWILDHSSWIHSGSNVPPPLVLLYTVIHIFDTSARDVINSHTQSGAKPCRCGTSWSCQWWKRQENKKGALTVDQSNKTGYSLNTIIVQTT